MLIESAILTWFQQPRVSPSNSGSKLMNSQFQTVCTSRLSPNATICRNGTFEKILALDTNCRMGEEKSYNDNFITAIAEYKKHLTHPTH